MNIEWQEENLLSDHNENHLSIAQQNS